MTKYDDLLKKGFSKKEAKRTVEIIKKAKGKRSSKIRFLDSVIYWVLLMVAIVGNMVISIILIPFLLAFKFEQLIREIEHIENKHQIIAWIFIPALAIINVYYMTSFANHLTETLKLPLALNSPIIVSVIYVIAFIFPYGVHNIIEVTLKS
jgi:hypothetical protein